MDDLGCGSLTSSWLLFPIRTPEAGFGGGSPEDVMDRLLWPGSDGVWLSRARLYLQEENKSGAPLQEDHSSPRVFLHRAASSTNTLGWKLLLEDGESERASTAAGRGQCSQKVVLLSGSAEIGRDNQGTWMEKK